MSHLGVSSSMRSSSSLLQHNLYTPCCRDQPRMQLWQMQCQKDSVRLSTLHASRLDPPQACTATASTHRVAALLLMWERCKQASRQRPARASASRSLSKHQPRLCWTRGSRPVGSSPAPWPAGARGLPSSCPRLLESPAVPGLEACCVGDWLPCLAEMGLVDRGGESSCGGPEAVPTWSPEECSPS